MPVASAAFALMTVVAPLGPPSLADAAKQLGVRVEDMDAGFGVVAIDPQRGNYAVQARADRLPAGKTVGSKTFAGPWANPRIDAFGPIEK